MFDNTYQTHFTVVHGWGVVGRGSSGGGIRSGVILEAQIIDNREAGLSADGVYYKF